MTGSTSHQPKKKAPKAKKEKQKEPQKLLRLQKRIADLGYCSRRKAEEFIAAGKVLVNGEKASIGDKVSVDDEIKIDGKILEDQEKIYLAVYKPAGYVSTTEDTHGRKTVLDLLPPQLRNVKPAGRLDLDSEGLIILSNDGDFIQKLTHPKYTHLKDYSVKVKGTPTPETLEKLTSGELELDGYKLNPMQYVELHPGAYIITLSEGRKRQIREVFKLLGHPVVYLKRLRVGPISLDQLKKGEYRHLNKKEIQKCLEHSSQS